MDQSQGTEREFSSLDMNSAEFRRIGHRLVERLGDFLESLPGRPVTTGEAPQAIRQALDAERTMPARGSDPAELMDRAANLLFDHSLFNGHPRFWGYITSSAAPIGALAELLAAVVNANVGAWLLSPMASEIEAQTIRWIAELLDYPSDCGGLLVSGGNMANLVCLLAARQAKAGCNVREQGVGQSRLRVYCSRETHTWIQKAADMLGLGTNSLRWLPTDQEQRASLPALREQIAIDRASGDQPFMVIGTAGTVSTGAIDQLGEMAAICREFNLWFHVDGAYGGFAAMLPDAAADLLRLAEADSVAVDPHKWLYAPLEAGCALVRNPQHLRDAFAYHPPYYHFGVEAINYFDFGPQNSRGFRALKIWLALQQTGREGYVSLLSHDIYLAEQLFTLVGLQPELEACTQSLSITTFRYRPADMQGDDSETNQYLNQLNRELLSRLQEGGEAYVSNAVLGERFVLRACIVNFRSCLADIEALPRLVVRIGRAIDLALRPAAGKSDPSL
jgi:glutamate/tyrosine decarboxylase-like PLP-dependent enzyme